MYSLYSDVLGEDFSPSSGSSLIWSIMMQYNGTLGEIRVITWLKMPEDGLKSSPETSLYRGYMD